MANHPGSGGQVFHVADADALSSKELALRLGKMLKRPPRLVSIPIPLLRILGSVLRRSEDIRRLTGSLRVATEKIRRQLGWIPPFTLEQGLLRTVAWYRSTRKNAA